MDSTCGASPRFPTLYSYSILEFSSTCDAFSRLYSLICTCMYPKIPAPAALFCCYFLLTWEQNWLVMRRRRARFLTLWGCDARVVGFAPQARPILSTFDVMQGVSGTWGRFAPQAKNKMFWRQNYELIVEFLQYANMANNLL